MASPTIKLNNISSERNDSFFSRFFVSTIPNASKKKTVFTFSASLKIFVKFMFALGLTEYLRSDFDERIIIILSNQIGMSITNMNETNMEN